MTRIALLSAAALIGAGALASLGGRGSRRRRRRCGLIGGLAAGAPDRCRDPGAFRSRLRIRRTRTTATHPRPWWYGPRPAYRVYEEDGPVYAPRRAVTYERVPVGYGPARHWRRDWDDGYGYRGW